MKYRKRQRLRTAANSGCPRDGGSWMMKKGRVVCGICGDPYKSPNPEVKQPKGEPDGSAHEKD